MAKVKRLQKGARGDWSQEGGYKFHQRWSDFPDGSGKFLDLAVTHDSTGHDNPWQDIEEGGSAIANASFYPPGKDEKGETRWIGVPWTHPKHERKGIASSLYSRAEKIANMKLRPDTGAQTPHAQKLWAQKDRPFGKSEHLRKGVARRKFGKFNPRSSEYDEIKEDLYHWTDLYSDSAARERAYSKPTSQSENERFRAFNKLAAATKSRRNKETGEREFLLHRGASDPEWESQVHAKGGNLRAHHNDMHSSWTPHYDVAQGFVTGNLEDDPEEAAAAKKNVMSAWIKESDIAGVPNQLHANPQFSKEHEVIVRPGHGSQLIHHDEPRASKLSEKIHQNRVRRERDAAIGSRPKKLAASMTLEDKMRQKLQKSDNLLKKPETLVHQDIHSDSTWKDQHPELYHGVDLSTNLHTSDSTSTTPDFKLVPNRQTGETIVIKGPIPHEQHKYWTENKPGARESLHPFSHFHHPSFQTTQREAAFYDAMKNVFDLGHVVPRTTVFRDPNHGKPMSAQEFISGRVYREPKDLRHFENTGDLHKMAIAETILGHNDRHKSNIIVHKKKPYLIDNALTFDYSGLYGTRTPAYIKHMIHHGLPTHVHKWLQGLSSNTLKDILMSRGAHEDIAKMAMRRLEELQKWSKLTQANRNWSQDLGSGLILAGMHEIPRLGERDTQKHDIIRHGYESLKRGTPLISQGTLSEDAETEKVATERNR